MVVWLILLMIASKKVTRFTVVQFIKSKILSTNITMNDNDSMVENDASSTSSISSTSTAQSIQRITRSIVCNHFTAIDGKARCNYCSR